MTDRDEKLLEELEPVFMGICAGLPNVRWRRAVALALLAAYKREVRAEALEEARAVVRYYANPDRYALRMTRPQIRELVEADESVRVQMDQRYGLPLVLHDKGDRAREFLGLDPNDEETLSAWQHEIHDEMARAAAERDPKCTP